MKKTLLYSIVALSVFGMVGVNQVSAFDGLGKGGVKGNRLGLLSPEIRDSFKDSKKKLTKDEKDKLKLEREAARQDKAKEMENFLGLSRDEVKQMKSAGMTMGDIARKQGKTEDDVRAFFTERVGAHADRVIESHNLTQEQVATLKSRISQVVENIVKHWFNK